MKIIEKITSNRFGKNFMFLAGGTFIAQLSHALMTPIITRLYSPDEYGVLTAYLSILGIFSFGAFTYEKSIPIASSDEEASDILVLCMSVLIGYVLLLLLAFTLWGSQILSYLERESLVKYMIYISIGVLLSGLYKILRQWVFRRQDFKTISKSTVAQSLLGNTAKIILGLLGLGPLGLIIGGLIRESAGSSLLLKQGLISKTISLKTVSFNKVLWVAKRYKDFPFFNFPTNFLNTLSGKLPMIFLTFFYGISTVGYYGLSNSVVQLPMKLIGMSIGDVYYSEAAKYGRENPMKLKKLSNSLMKKLSLIGLLPLAIFQFFGPYIFGLVYGNEWSESGIYARITSIMLYFILIFAPVSRVYEVFEKQKKRLFIDIVKIILVSSAFFASQFFVWGAYIAIALYSAVMSFIHFLIYLNAQKIINDEIKVTNFAK